MGGGFWVRLTGAYLYHPTAEIKGTIFKAHARIIVNKYLL